MASAAVLTAVPTDKAHMKSIGNSASLSTSPPYRRSQSPPTSFSPTPQSSASTSSSSDVEVTMKSRSTPPPVQIPKANGDVALQGMSLPMQGAQDESRFGQPPPSPPASIEENPISTLKATQSEPYGISSPQQPPVVFEEPEQVIEYAPTVSSAPLPSRPPPAARSATVEMATSSARVSFEAKSSLSVIRPGAQSDVSPPADILPPSISHVDAAKPSSSEFLQPPPLSMHNTRVTRRNTTGSSFARFGGAGMGPGVRASLHAQFNSQPGPAAVFEEDMASDIQLHADRIRKERQEKRAKQQAEAEAALTQPKKGEEVPLVGNLIGEDHVNYVLMYNMLTGIRIAVSRCQAKIRRPLTDDDFAARHKFSFDIVGNELTPSAKYDFKFKDYAPWVFRSLREEHFHLDPADYLLSLTSKYILSELGSPGKSGSFFYFSRDYRFIIKTIHHSEHKFILKVLKQYYEHVKENPHTLLSRFYGLHRVKLPHGKKIHFVIMNNLFPPHKDIHETYDLKGSTVGRESAPDAGVQKDLNWINKGRTLEFGPEKRALLTEQLRRDKEMLKKIHVMDYSLLVGVHNMQRGNKDNVRKNTLKVFEPDFPRRHAAGQTSGSHKGSSRANDAMAMRRAMRESDLKRLHHQLPEKLDSLEDRQHFIFYQDEGGMRATDESNEQMDTIYYLGVIDILTPYSKLKKIEHIWKGLSADRHKISPVPPEEYADRFFAFMKAIMRGGGGGASFK